MAHEFEHFGSGLGIEDTGHEFCDWLNRHPHEPFLQLKEIEHRTTKVRRPQSNGFVKRQRRTLPDEHFRLQGRKKLYEKIEETQKGLKGYLNIYNSKRRHQGRNMRGRTLTQPSKMDCRKL